MTTKKADQLLRIHGSWLIFLVIFASTFAYNVLPELPEGTNQNAAIISVLAAVAFFISILIHASGHVLSAKILRLKQTRRILFPFGDLAHEHQCENIDYAPFISLTGPLASLIVANCWHFLYLFAKTRTANNTILVSIETLANLNILIAWLNLLPLRPFDGYAFAVYLSSKKPICHKQPRMFITDPGRIIPVLSFIVASIVLYRGHLYTGVWIFLAGYIIKEALFFPTRSHYSVNAPLATVADYMRINPVTVQSTISLREFTTNYLFRFHTGMFPVMCGSKLNGFIVSSKVKEIPEILWGKFTVSDMMEKCNDQNTVFTTSNIFQAINLMHTNATDKLIVLEYEELAGIITLQDTVPFFANLIDKSKKRSSINTKDTNLHPVINR